MLQQRCKEKARLNIVNKQIESILWAILVCGHNGWILPDAGERTRLINKIKQRHVFVYCK
jgi:hypothetical protein